MSRPFDTSSLDTIVSGARLLATASGQDPEVMESIVRKSARIARENLLQDARVRRANDKD